MGRPSLLGLVAAMPLGTDKIHPAICESHASYMAYSSLSRQGATHEGNLDRINKINRIRTVEKRFSHRGTKPQRKISISQSAMSLSQRHEDAKKKQSGVDRIYKINKIYRMATGCARCSGWPNQSSSVAASELARRRLPDCFIRCANDTVSRSAKKSEIRN